MKNCYPFENTPLPYAYDALEPYIDEKTMRLHHDKHLQTYIDNLNRILQENAVLQKLTLEQLIKNSCILPQKLQSAVRNNAGGVYNHRFYFEGLSVPSQQMPTGSLAAAIDRCFGSFEHFKKEFKQAALSVFGSGYAWLVFNRGKLQIITTPNQNTPIESCLCPLCNVDVWEHAYYLKHCNVRSAYLEDWFCVINWRKVQQAYSICAGDGNGAAGQG